ncbi:glycine cleavage system protein GcvH [Staphylococcus carnosus]|uniref:Glycine cleavage system H protein n=1 Tax=Staphylococcus carnosus (strain TM300) TaxID=396513 RepID=GCSH_STACT|nr:glycine cleavage system protein GcvH [Staphylococcus carnosus]B9DJH3.1 RecName: Full=Glycine cleavage system H protein; AltName: Full=Octanoyl/lipoyl carrier protein [Staphylococcus carnosus subsp. carnosus TM300]QPT03542.1 glycine cleavage system protein GcvH [Staphylococcus carnosus]UQA66265.1 glycine cleavage system protein GcvH [Staphylococcus carnosus]UTB78897.1 glycine cleavage system protein H [Staphylococcus carnosus]UTB88450.1 glycine cleavage system protein H [Staphylococcus carno
MAVPEELKYSKEHEWVKVEGDTVTIGITEYAQGELGDIVFVELPETEDDIEESESFGSVESVKTVSELYAPVSGSVVEINEELEDSPEFVNESPYEKAWMVKVKLNDESQLDDLLSADQYKEMIGE